jgi:galactose mutarotase-like enzyme
LQNDTTYFGAIVGRVANRIGRAQFTLDGTDYKLVPNDGRNMLHGAYIYANSLFNFNIFLELFII